MKEKSKEFIIKNFKWIILLYSKNVTEIYVVTKKNIAEGYC